MRILRLCRHGTYLLMGAILGGTAFFLLTLIITRMLLDDRVLSFHGASLTEAPAAWVACLTAPFGAVVGVALGEALYRRAT